MSKHIACSVLLSLVAFSHAQALELWPYPWPYCGDYPGTVSTIVSQNIDRVTGQCHSVPLTLERTVDGSLTVDAWHGGYDLAVQMTTVYQLDHYDVCSGNYLWSEQQSGTVAQTLLFNVDNPNLNSGQPSYASNAPMTDREAQAALPAALRACRAAHAGPW